MLASFRQAGEGPSCQWPKSDFPSSIVVLICTPTNIMFVYTIVDRWCLRLVFWFGHREGAHGRLVGTGSSSRLTYGPAAPRPARPPVIFFLVVSPTFFFPGFQPSERSLWSGNSLRWERKRRKRSAVPLPPCCHRICASRALGNLRRQGRRADDEGPRDGEIRGRRPEVSAVRPWPSLVDLGSPVVFGTGSERKSNHR